jgi:hypothetical protein
MKQLGILFAGEPANVKLISGDTLQVYVRALPQRKLGELLEVCEHKHALVELCTYLPRESTDVEITPGMTRDAILQSALVPDGKQPVPIGWADNLEDESLDLLYEIAQRLNFHRAAKWAQGQIAAKKFLAPIQQLGIQQVIPLVEQIMSPLIKRLDALSNSTPSVPSSSGSLNKPS